MRDGERQRPGGRCRPLSTAVGSRPPRLALDARRAARSKGSAWERARCGLDAILICRKAIVDVDAVEAQGQASQRTQRRLRSQLGIIVAEEGTEGGQNT